MALDIAQPAGLDFTAYKEALDRGDPDEANRIAEKMLEAVAPPAPELVAQLNRRVNEAFAASRTPAAEPHADHGSQPVQRPRERRATSRARSRSPGSSSGEDPEPPPPRELAARLLFLEECIEDGDHDTAAAIVRDLLAELPLERGRACCRWCTLAGWPGEVERHERIVHAHEVLDLEEAA